MGDNAENIKQVIFDVYDKGYFDKYGGSFLIVFLVVLIIVGLVYYTKFIDNIGYMRRNWGTQRCVPSNMPFAAEAFPPTDGQTKASVIIDNYSFCVDSVLEGVVDTAVSPVLALLGSLVGIFKKSQGSLNQVWTGLTGIRAKMAAYANAIALKVYAMAVELQRLMFKINDTFSKLTGVFAAAFQSIMTFYYTTQSFMGAFYEIMQKATLYFIGLAIMFYSIPFFAALPAAVAMSAVASLLAGSMVAFSVAAAPIIDLSKYWVPKVPGFCFSGDTRVRLFDGTSSIMSEIRPGMMLVDGSIVTSHMKFPSYTSRMVRLGEHILVTADHRVLHNGKFSRVGVCNIGVVEEYTQKHIYCINTSTKLIGIDDYVFTDYDELTPQEERVLSDRVGVIERSELSTHYEGGFHPHTAVKMNDGTVRRMDEVDVGDMLAGNSRVLGVIHGMERECVFYPDMLDVNNNEVVCSENTLLRMFVGRRGITPKYRFSASPSNRSVVVPTVHFLTNTRSVPVGTHMFWDFDMMTDFYLERDGLE